MPRNPRDMQILRANAEVGDLKREVAELKALALRKEECVRTDEEIKALKKNTKELSPKMRDGTLTEAHVLAIERAIKERDEGRITSKALMVAINQAFNPYSSNDDSKHGGLVSTEGDRYNVGVTNEGVLEVTRVALREELDVPSVTGIVIAASRILVALPAYFFKSLLSIARGDFGEVLDHAVALEQSAYPLNPPHEEATDLLCGYPESDFV